jgi:glycosyltransferase involved in cell wall biosynthesis
MSASIIRVMAGVVRGEGIASALRRTADRIDEGAHHALLHARGALVRASAAKADFTILNVAAAGLSPRTGGVATQLVTRLRAERDLRNVALLSPRGLELSAPILHSRPVAPFHSTRAFVAPDFEQAVREALTITGARAIHLEGASGLPVGSVLRLLESGVPVFLTVHDFSLFCARPHLFEQPMERFCSYSHDLERCHRCLGQTWKVSANEQAERRSLGRRLLESATGLICPSRFLLEQHREIFSLPALEGEIIEPGAPPAARATHRVSERRAIAYAGSVKRHKGVHLLPDIVRMVNQASVDLDWHVFGGGDEDLLHAMRRLPNVRVHGYYRAGALPSLLARHDIGMIVLPSIVPETFSLVLSEAWLAGVPVAAFDLGATAERIGRDTGWLAPLESGAAGLAEIIERWLSGQITADVPGQVTTQVDTARAHVELYRRWRGEALSS